MERVENDTLVRVRDLLDQYFYALDTRDFELLADCFIPEATMGFYGGAIVREGRDVFIAELKTFFNFQESTHTLANMRISRAQTGLIGHVTATSHLLTHQNKIMARGLRYADAYVEHAGQWKIARRSHQVMWQFEADAVTLVPPVQARDD